MAYAFSCGGHNYYELDSTHKWRWNVDNLTLIENAVEVFDFFRFRSGNTNQFWLQ